MDNLVELKRFQAMMEHKRHYAKEREKPKDDGPLIDDGHVTIARDFLRRRGLEDGLVGTYGDTLMVYCDESGIWESMSRKNLSFRVRDYNGYPHMERGKKKPMRLTDSQVKGVVNSILGDSILVPEEFFARRPVGLQFRNGFLQFADGEAHLNPNSPSNRAVWGVPYDYDPEAKCPRWDAFHEEIFRGDPDGESKSKTLQQFFGACLRGKATTYQKCLVFQGAGANGKSILLEVVKQALFAGKRIISCAPQNWGHEYYSADLFDADMNIVTEMPGREIMASERFKAVITGDAISARRPHGCVFSFRPRAGHIFACNNLPASNDDSHGYWRRFVVIEFNRKFDESDEREEDQDLINNLLAETPGIMAWAIRGALELDKTRELTVPSSHHKNMKEWQLNTNVVAAFVEDCCERQTNNFTPVKEIYNDFRDYVSSVGRKPLAQNTLGQRLRRLGIQRRHTRDGNQYQLMIKQRGLWTST